MYIKIGKCKIIKIDIQFDESGAIIYMQQKSQSENLIIIIYIHFNDANFDSKIYIKHQLQNIKIMLNKEKKN